MSQLEHPSLLLTLLSVLGASLEYPSPLVELSGARDLVKNRERVLLCSQGKGECPLLSSYMRYLRYLLSQVGKVAKGFSIYELESCACGCGCNLTSDVRDVVWVSGLAIAEWALLRTVGVPVCSKQSLPLPLPLPLDSRLSCLVSSLMSGVGTGELLASITSTKLEVSVYRR